MDTANAKSQKGLSGDLFKNGQISRSRGCVGLWRHYIVMRPPKMMVMMGWMGF